MFLPGAPLAEDEDEVVADMALDTTAVVATPGETEDAGGGDRETAETGEVEAAAEEADDPALPRPPSEREDAGPGGCSREDDVATGGCRREEAAEPGG